jgi:hypothetical protein
MKSRREFLNSAAALPLVAAGLAASLREALAAPPPRSLAATSISTSTSTTGNGLLIGSSIEAGMFKNLVRSLANVQSNAGYAYPAILDVNGYPKSSPTYNIFGIIPQPSTLTASTQMVLKWTGTGSVQLARGAPGFNVVSGSQFVSGSAAYNLTVTGSNPRVVFTFNGAVPASVSFYFLAGAQFSGMGGLVYCRLTDESAVDTATTPDAMFDDNYVAAYQSMKARVFRPMQWTNPNFGNVSRASYIANWQTSLVISDQRWVPSAWAGSTTGTNTYSCPKQPDGANTYADGEMIQLQFSNANTSTTVSLNSGSRGAVPVINNTGTPLAAGQIQANSLATLTYDAILKAFLWQAGGQTQCLPFELQVGFANRIGANYWCNLPNYLDDASISSIAAIVRGRLATTATAYFEYGNEIWNFGFQSSAWSAARGAALGFPSDNNRQIYGWYGLRVRQVMANITSTWAPRQSSQLKRVMAFQAFGPVLATWTYRFEGADLTANYPAYAAAGYPNYNVSPNRPIDYCDVLSYATYYSGAQCTNFDANYIGNGAAGIAALLAAADNFASGESSKMSVALAFLDNDFRAGALSTGTKEWQTLLGLTTVNGPGIYAPWDAQAAKYNKLVECYEGGFESNFPSVQACSAMGLDQGYGGPTGKIANLLTAYKNSTLFASLVQTQLANFFAQPHSRTAAWYVFATGPSQWSITSGGPYDPKFQSWNGLTTYKY